MVKCSKCGKTIPKGTRYIIGNRKGKYHVFCGSDIKDKSYKYTKGRYRK